MVASPVKGKRGRHQAKARKVADWYYVQEFQALTNGDGTSQALGDFDSLEESLAWFPKDARSVVKDALKSGGPANQASMRRHYTKSSSVVIRNARDVVAVVKWRIRKGELVALVYDLADCGVREIPVTS